MKGCRGESERLREMEGMRRGGRAGERVREMEGCAGEGKLVTE